MSDITITPPELSSLSRSAIMSFLPKYDSYLARVENHNSQATTTASRRLTPSSLKLCLNVPMMENAIALGLIEGNSFQELTDEHLSNFLKERLKSGDTVSRAQKLASIVKKLSFKPNSTDPFGAVDSFFLAFMKAAKLENFPLSTTKSTVETLANILQPQVFRSKVISELKFWEPFEFLDIKLVCKKFREIADQTSALWDQDGRSQDQNSRKRKGASSSAAQEPQGSRALGPQGSSKGPADGSTQQGNGAPKCLNDECNGFHLVKHCPITSQNKKRKLLLNRRPSSVSS